MIVRSAWCLYFCYSGTIIYKLWAFFLSSIFYFSVSVYSVSAWSFPLLFLFASRLCLVWFLFWPRSSGLFFLVVFALFRYQTQYLVFFGLSSSDRFFFLSCFWCSLPALYIRLSLLCFACRFVAVHLLFLFIWLFFVSTRSSGSICVSDLRCVSVNSALI